nr:MAG TPA: hypothetical protein [Caudoviricetes sp.]
MKIFLSCLHDRIAYEYTSKRKEFLIYADSWQEAVEKLKQYKRLIGWFDADEYARELDDIVDLDIDGLDEEEILRGDLNAYLVNEIEDGEYKCGSIAFGKSAAEVRRALPEYNKNTIFVISALPKIEDIIL